MQDAKICIEKPHGFGHEQPGSQGGRSEERGSLPCDYVAKHVLWLAGATACNKVWAGCLLESPQNAMDGDVEKER